MPQKRTAKSETVARRRAKLLKQATKVFCDRGAAEKWLHEPQIGLGGGIPYELARTAKGRDEVSKLLTRVDYGVYA